MPTPLTHSAWVSLWNGLAITGVTHLPEPPLALDRVILPAGFLARLEARSGVQVVSCRNNNKQRAAVYQIATEARGQNTQVKKFEEVNTLVDTVESALDGLRGTIANFFDYSILVVDDIEIAGIKHWGLEIRATGSNAPI